MTTRLVKRPKISPQQASKDPLERLRQNARTPVLPVPFAQALTVLLTEQKHVNRSRLQRIRAAWEMAVEQTPGLSAAARRAEVRSIGKTGAVQVLVDSPALAHELGVVYRGALLACMRELLQGKDSVSELVVKLHGRRK
ncbi:MAG: hypothetical protein M5U25_00175 [Planctomycetota bacterium]|nr:hypothetical protein [Planctomycetota bacterium]